jgi:hypothetical protein
MKKWRKNKTVVWIPHTDQSPKSKKEDALLTWANQRLSGMRTAYKGEMVPYNHQHDSNRRKPPLPRAKTWDPEQTMRSFQGSWSACSRSWRCWSAATRRRRKLTRSLGKRVHVGSEGGANLVLPPMQEAAWDCLGYGGRESPEQAGSQGSPTPDRRLGPTGSRGGTHQAACT